MIPVKAMFAYFMICENDKFATLDEHIYYHLADNVPKCAVTISTPASVDSTYDDRSSHTLAQKSAYTHAQQAIFAIKKSDSELLGWVLPDNVQFVATRQLIDRLTPNLANQLAKAVQLLRWRDDHQYCSRCGNPTEQHSSENAMVCLNCHYHQYPRIQPCIITAIIHHMDNQPHILLAHHHRASVSKMYGLIAGFVEVGESLEQCLHREVMEEVGLTVNQLQYIASQPWAYPSNLMVGFIANYQSGKISIDEQELIHADFFPLHSLGQTTSPIIPPKGTIAYDLIQQAKRLYPLS